MDPELEGFLARHTRLAEDREVRGSGTLPLRIESYLGEADPPRSCVTSVRCLTFQSDRILLVRNPGGIHILPGGQLNGGEGYEEALRRVLLEETGWSISNPERIGFMHFHHLDSIPQESDDVSSDFVQLVYVSQADQHMPDAESVDDSVGSSSFEPVAEVVSLDLSRGEKLYLKFTARDL